MSENTGPWTKEGSQSEREAKNAENQAAQDAHVGEKDLDRVAELLKELEAKAKKK